IGVLAVSIVTIILGLGLGLGLQLEDCKVEMWECSRLRCGEKRISGKSCGTHAPYMQAAFPTLTFPNHYTIVTGLYSESHGLVDNSMYDPIFDASFSLSNSEKSKPRWYQGQPEVDRIIGQLMNGLKQMELHRCINIIIVADHGMEDTSCKRVETLQSLIGDVTDLYVYQGAFGRIRAFNGQQTLNSAELVANMTCAKPDQQIKPYLKPDLPKRFHYANNRRIEDATVLVNAQWVFARTESSLTYCDGGTHGYDNDIYSMQAMFLSYGPKFLYKTQVDPFSNIELYNLMCDVLEIEPAPNNGTHGSLNHLLKKPRHSPSFPAEQTGPGQCPLETLNPADPLGCTCPDQVTHHSATEQMNRNSS
ncbi:hypothetical protein JZ751_004369, partial [Albula glossodonta]